MEALPADILASLFSDFKVFLRIRWFLYVLPLNGEVIPPTNPYIDCQRPYCAWFSVPSPLPNLNSYPILLLDRQACVACCIMKYSKVLSFSRPFLLLEVYQESHTLQVEMFIVLYFQRPFTWIKQHGLMSIKHCEQIWNHESGKKTNLNVNRNKSKGVRHDGTTIYLSISGNITIIRSY